MKEKEQDGVINYLGTIRTKFAEYSLVPHRLDVRNGIYVTTDEQAVNVRVIGFYDNTDPKIPSDDYLNTICQRLYKMDFQTVRLAWIRRIGTFPDKWVQIRMERIQPEMLKTTQYLQQ
jgi:hypothetical protein